MLTNHRLNTRYLLAPCQQHRGLIPIGLAVIHLLLTLSPTVWACSLTLTAPPNGTVVNSAHVRLTGQGSASAKEGDQGHVIATLNGKTIFRYSGSFRTATTFLRSRGVRITLQAGINTIDVSGSVGSCRASHSISLLYEPTVAANNMGHSPHSTCQPINIATGNKFFAQHTWSGTGVSPLQHHLFYNTHARNQPWSSDYRQSLTITTGIIQAHRQQGQDLTFTVDTGRISAQSQRQERLALNGDIYTLTLRDNTVERYNRSGQLLSIRYANGIMHTLSYGDNTVTISRNGESLVLDITDKHITRATLPDGSVISYRYDTANGVNRLLTTTYADGSTRTYLYENSAFPHYITGIIDANGQRIASVQYDSQGRASSSEAGPPGSGIKRSQITYHNDGTRTVTNSLGKQAIYHFTQFNGEYKLTRIAGQASAHCAAANQAYTYDRNGFMATKTDWQGNITTYTHNDRGLETSRTEASGTPQARTITTQWHHAANLPLVIREPERETVFAYDDQGRLMSQEVKPR